MGFLAMQPLRGSHIGIYAVAVRLALRHLRRRCAVVTSAHLRRNLATIIRTRKGFEQEGTTRSVGRAAWRRLNPRLIVIATLAGCPYSRLSAPQRSLSFSPISP